MAIDGGKIISTLELDTSGFSSQLQSARSQMETFADQSETLGTRMSSLGSAMTGLGAQLSKAVTLPVAAVMTVASKSAISFESAFAGVRKTVDATEAQFDELSDAILRMSENKAMAATELADIMASAGQLGVSQEHLEAFTGVIADLSVATNLTSEEAASMLAQFANVMGMDLSNIGRLGSVIDDLGNHTATTEKDIVEMAQRLSGAAHTVGMTESAVMALAATMTSLGINAEAGGSAMSRVMQSIEKSVQSGDEKLEAFAKASGMDAKAFAAAWKKEPVKVLSAFIKGLNAVNAAGGNVYEILESVEISDVRMTDAILRMSGAAESLEENARLANDAWEQNTALSAEAEKRYGTTESALTMMKNALSNAAATLGNELLPYIKTGAEWIQSLAQRFSALDSGVKKGILTFAGIAAAIGPVMTLVGGLITLLSGPAGIAVAAGLALAAIAGLIGYLNEKHKAELLDDLQRRFGTLELSAEEIKTLVENGIGVTVDMSEVTAAQEKLEGFREDYNTLSNTLHDTVLALNAGWDLTQVEDPQEMVTKVVSAAQTLLNEEQNAAKLSVQAFFGENEQGQLIQGDLDAYFSGLEGELTQKGEELGQAMLLAIADGEIDDVEKQVILNLQNEIDEITTRAMMIENDAAIEAAKVKKGHAAFTADTYQNLAAEMTAFAEDQRAQNEALWEQQVNAVTRMKSAGMYDEAQFSERLSAVETQYGQNAGQIVGDTLRFAEEVIVRDVYDAFADVMQFEANNGQKSLSQLHESYTDEEITGYLNAKENARAFVESLQAVYDYVDEAKDQMGGALPEEFHDLEYQLSSLKALATTGISPDWRYDRADAEGETATLKVEADTAPARAAVEEEDEHWLPAVLQVEADVAPAREAVEEAEEHFPDAVIPVDADLSEAEKTAQEEGDRLAKLISPYEPLVFPVEADVTPAQETIAQEAGQFTDAVLQVEADVSKARATVEEEDEHWPFATLPVQADEGQARKAGQETAATAGSALNSGLSGAKSAGADFGQGYANSIRSKITTVRNAASDLGKASVDSLRVAIDAHSPSELTWEAGSDYTAGFARGISSSAKDVIKSASGLGTDAVDAIFVTGGNDEVAPAAKTWARTTAKKATSTLVSALSAQMRSGRSEIERSLGAWQDSRAQLISLAGEDAVWYDSDPLGKLLEESESKFDRLTRKAESAFNKLSEKQQESQRSTHEAYLQELQEAAREEQETIRENYNLQKQLAEDFLDERLRVLRTDLDAKRAAYDEEDYEKELADLQKRARQTKSARERRELSEQIEKLERDHALELEEDAYDKLSETFGVLKNALNAGVIGLGDLTGDRSLGREAFGEGGLARVTGIDAEALEEALRTLEGGIREGAGGNTYQIDLSGAVIRDDSDIERIVEAFDKRMRELERGVR